MIMCLVLAPMVFGSMLITKKNGKQLINSKNGLPFPFPSDPLPITSIWYSAEQQTLVTVEETETDSYRLRAWDAQNYSEIAALNLGSPPWAGDEENLLFLANSPSNTLVLSLESGQFTTRRIPSSTFGRDPTFRYLVTNDFARWNIATATHITDLSSGNLWNAVTFSPNGEYLFVFKPDGSGTLRQTATGNPIMETSNYDAVEFSRDSTLLIGKNGRHYSVYDIRNKTWLQNDVLVGSLDGYHSPYYKIDPIQKRLISFNARNPIAIWDAKRMGEDAIE